MTTIDTVVVPFADADIRARPAGFIHDLVSIAGRALRAVPRDLEAVIPPVFIALFFFVVNIATLARLTERAPGFDYTAFQMATAVLLASPVCHARARSCSMCKISTSIACCSHPFAAARSCSVTWRPTSPSPPR